MLQTIRATRGMAVAPHAGAAESGCRILRDGGNALDAAIAMAASLSVLYPHMTGVGGDSFWLCYSPETGFTTIDASGRSPRDVAPAFYRARGLAAVPTHGPLAALTVAGTVCGWQAAFAFSRERWAGRLPLARLLEDAITAAEQGYTVTGNQAQVTARRLDELRELPGFAETYLVAGRTPAPGTLLRQPRLGATLRHLRDTGLQDFYDGELARSIARDLERLGSPLRLADLQDQRAELGTPLALPHARGTLYNLGPPTQGLASLLILGIFERRGGVHLPLDSADYVHLLVEATKQAYRVRDRFVCDPMDMTDPTAAELLEPAFIERLSAPIDMRAASPWQGPGDIGDTTWFGAIDEAGRAVSAIQSLYHGFGSGMVLPQSGICWHNRGVAFSLGESGARRLRPGRKPFHTLNPAMAKLDDGRLLVYGTMGGDGQPQTLAAVFTRYVEYAQDLQATISAPRWVIGRTWGKVSNALKLENRFPQNVADELATRGHLVETVGGFDSLMGHAGALVRRPDGVIEGASDPRCDGAAVGFQE